MRTLVPIRTSLLSGAALSLLATVAVAQQPAAQPPVQPQAQMQAPAQQGMPMGQPGQMMQAPMHGPMSRPMHGPLRGPMGGPGMMQHGPQTGMDGMSGMQGMGGMAGQQQAGQGVPGAMPDMSQGNMAQGQMPDFGPPPMHGPMRHPMMGDVCPPMMGPPDFAAGRTAFIKAELGLNDAQSAAFDAMAKVLNAHHQGSHERQAAMWASMVNARTPLERFAARITTTETRLGMMKEMKAALDKLYAVLNDEQKRKADFILPAMGGVRCMM